MSTRERGKNKMNSFNHGQTIRTKQRKESSRKKTECSSQGRSLGGLRDREEGEKQLRWEGGLTWAKFGVTKGGNFHIWGEKVDGGMRTMIGKKSRLNSWAFAICRGMTLTGEYLSEKKRFGGGGDSTKEATSSDSVS